MLYPHTGLPQSWWLCSAFSFRRPSQSSFRPAASGWCRSILVDTVVRGVLSPIIFCKVGFLVGWPSCVGSASCQLPNTGGDWCLAGRNGKAIGPMSVYAGDTLMAFLDRGTQCSQIATKVGSFLKEQCHPKGSALISLEGMLDMQK